MKRFDRHEILKAHYAEQIASDWNFAAIADECRRNAKDADCREDNGDSWTAYCYLGSVLNIAPSGKYYMPWTSNQTSADETRDGAFWEAFEEIADKHGLGIGQPENCGDGCDCFAFMCVEKTDDEEQS
jgi:hypothetical protein